MNSLRVTHRNRPWAKTFVLMHTPRMNGSTDRMRCSIITLRKTRRCFMSLQVKSHRGILAMFGEHYVKTEIFAKADGSLLSDLVIMRDNADYNCFFDADEEKLSPYIEPTRQSSAPSAVSVLTSSPSASSRTSSTRSKTSPQNNNAIVPKINNNIRSLHVKIVQ